MIELFGAYETDKYVFNRYILFRKDAGVAYVNGRGWDDEIGRTSQITLRGVMAAATEWQPAHIVRIEDIGKIQACVFANDGGAERYVNMLWYCNLYDAGCDVAFADYSGMMSILKNYEAIGAVMAMQVKKHGEILWQWEGL